MTGKIPDALVAIAAAVLVISCLIIIGSKAMKNIYRPSYRTFSVSLLLLLWVIGTGTAYSQTSAFAYQGRLTDLGSPADGLFDMQFKLFNTTTVGTGTQQGSTITNSTVQVENGVFSVQLDFAPCASCFDGSARFLEIGIRPAGSVDPYTVLSPRQPIASTPYAVRALDASQLGGIAASGFIQNTTTQQIMTNFNIGGNGTLGGALSANSVNAATRYDIGGFRVLSVAGGGNMFVGLGAGTGNTIGTNNSFFGNSAGAANQTGSFNSFFGTSAGVSNTASNNSFFGASAGVSNTAGTGNSFFGAFAGDANTTGFSNSFFGANAGGANQAGGNNSFFGNNAGLTNTASDNSFFGALAGDSNTTGTSNAFFGTRAGGANQTGNFNAFFGAFAGDANTTASNNAFFGALAGAANTTGTNNAFFGGNAGSLNTASFNSFFGADAGDANTTGTNNAFFGVNAGGANQTASFNSFFGSFAGDANTTGDNNAFFGASAGGANQTGTNNSFFGRSAGLMNTASNNAFFGAAAGESNTSGDQNTFFGSNAGSANQTGTNNAFFGDVAGDTNVNGSSLTIIGATADVGVDFLNNATAIGARARVDQSNSLVLGSISGINNALATVNVGIGTTTPADRLHVAGIIRVDTLGAAGGTQLCRNGAAQISTCSSSLRYKDHLAPFTAGLELINRLRPITFNWKQSGARDLGLGAEDVARVEPLLVTYNERGEVEGVKYDRVAVVLINAVREQQQQIAEKDEQIKSLRRQNAAFEARLTALEKQLSARKAAHKRP